MDSYGGLHIPGISLRKPGLFLTRFVALEAVPLAAAMVFLIVFEEWRC